MVKTPAWQCQVCHRENVRKDKAKSGWCNLCTKKEWEKNNPVKLRAQRLYGNAQKRAKDMGWPPPDFTSNWLEEKILNGFCEVTGIGFDLTSEATKSCHAKNPWVPSIDRIDSSKPYLKNNVQLVVFMYNVCKAEFHHNDVVTFCKSLLKKEKEIGL